MYVINWYCQNSGYLTKPTLQSLVKDIQLFIQLDIFLDKKMDIFLLYNHYLQRYPNFRDNHDLSIGIFYPSFIQSATGVVCMRARISPGVPVVLLKHECVGTNINCVLCVASIFLSDFIGFSRTMTSTKMWNVIE